MLRGTIRANHPSGQHAHGDAVFQKAPQRFVVDPTASECVFSKNGKPIEEMVFTVAFYDSLRPKIGAQLAVEPVGAPTGDAAAERISELEDEVGRMRAKLNEQRESFEGSWQVAQKELATARDGEAEARQQAVELERQLKAEQVRAAGFEQQLAAAKAPVELPAEPAAPTPPKVKAPK